MTRRPPPVGGVPTAGPRDALRIAWWTGRGYLYGTRHGHLSHRLLSGGLAAVWYPLLPVGVVLYVSLLLRPRARYYLSPERDAVLGISAGQHSWHVEDHIAARPGWGRGRTLRALVLPTLRAAADEAGLSIHLTAANDRLAAAYVQELPGLIEVGRAWPRGRKMRRDGAPTEVRKTPEQ